MHLLVGPVVCEALIAPKAVSNLLRVTLWQQIRGADRPRVPITEIVIGTIFFVAALGAILMTRVNGGIALIWPANAIAAALLIRLPRIRWLSAAFLLGAAGITANVAIAHRPWPISILFACLNGCEIGLMVWVFRSVSRFPYPNISIEQAALMTAVLGIAIPGLTGLAGGIGLYLNYGLSLSQGTLQWWGSHTIGACLIAPPIILFSLKSWRRLVSARFIAENLATLLIILGGCWLAIRYVRFPFVTVGVMLMIAAFRVGGFGASILGTCSGFAIAVLWALGVRPEGLESAPVVASLAGLPVVALLATTLPPIAVGLGTDARRAAVHQVNFSERRFREAMEHSPIGMLIADLNGVWGYTNLALQTMLGYNAAEFRALPPGGPSDPEDWTTSATRWQRLLSGETISYDVERRFRHKEGHWIWTHVAVSLMRDEEAQPLHLVAQIESLEARRRAEERLAEERETLRITLGSIDDAVITTDADKRITFMNTSAQSMLGLTMEAVQGRFVDEIVYFMDPQTSKAAEDLIGQSAVHGRVFRRHSPCILHRPDGSLIFVSDVVSPVLNSSGIVTGTVIVLRDASGEVSRTHDLKHRASHDPMTDLANRFEFQRRLSKAFTRAIHLEQPAAVLAIDLDRFKAVNDTAGHAAGDTVLRRVAEVLQTIVRQSDVVARLGGDEFAVILPNCPEASSLVVAQKILGALNPLRVEWQGSTHTIGASLGLAMLRAECQGEADWFEAADQACYQAKKEGRGQLRIAGSSEPVAHIPEKTKQA